MRKTFFMLLLTLCLLFATGCDTIDGFLYTKDVTDSDFEFSYTYEKGEHITPKIVALCDMRDACVRVEFYSSADPDVHSEGGGAYNFDLSRGESLPYGGYSLSGGESYDAARLIVISGKKK